MDKDEAYRLLNLSSGASLDDIKHSYKELSRKYHPDHNSDQVAHEMFILIKKAYDYLTPHEEEIISSDIHVPSTEREIAKPSMLKDMLDCIQYPPGLNQIKLTTLYTICTKYHINTICISSITQMPVKN